MIKYVHVNPFNSVSVHYFYNKLAFAIIIHLDFDIIFANREFTVLIVKSLLIHCDYRQFALILMQTHYLYGSFTFNSLFSSTGHFRYRESL